MKNLIFALLLVFTSNFALAGESKPLELPDTSKVKGYDAKNSGATFEMTCKTSEGRELKSGEVGYETCLSAAQTDLSSKQKGATGTQTGTGSNFNMKFGN